MTIDPDVQAALLKASDQLFEAHRDDPNFTGCGVGFRRRAGRRTDEPVVIAMVVKKLPAGAVSRRRLLPTTVEIDGRRWGVDVVEAGPVIPNTVASAGPHSAGPDVGGPITQKMRPPLQGCSISNINAGKSAGTFGCLVRDKSDKTICLLSCNHVIARSNQASLHEVIIQPGGLDGGTSADGIAFLKHFIPFVTGTNYVDAAIAQLVPQTGYSPDVADNLMKPISATHPAVGMVKASDSSNNCFLCRMDRTISLLGVSLLLATPESSCVIAPRIDMKIEKVGRTSGYTSSIIDAIGVQIKINYPGIGTAVFKDMIWTQAFNLPGDSGAVACQGGNGRTFVPPPEAPCPVLGSVGSYFNLPLTKDNSLTSQIKNQFLFQSLAGNLIIGLIYVNAQTVINRVKNKKAPGVEQSYAEEYYNKYLAIAKAALADPGSKTRVVTQGNLDDFQFILAGLSGAGGLPPLLTADESKAMQKLYTDVIVQTKGMDYQKVVSYMNETSVTQKVIQTLEAAPTITMTGTVVDD